MDINEVIKALEICVGENDFSACINEKCPYIGGSKDGYCITNLERDALTLLKEDCHNCKLECLLQKYDELKEKYDALLKEQEPLEPYECEGDMICGNGCEIVGYIRESDGKIERLSNFCPYCGRPVKWD